MPPTDKIRTLSPEEITSFKEQGHNLSTDKYYTITGMFDNKWNQAADPGRFKIATSALDKIAKTAPGKPWIPAGNNINKHVRPYPLASAAEIVKFQKEFAGGEIISYIHNFTSNIVYAIIEIWPDFIDMIEKKQVYPFTSVMIGNQLPNENGEYIDGEVLHIQSVKTPGYSPSFARFKGFCTGGIKQCMEELRPMAAAGLLVKFRNKSINHSVILQHLKNPYAAHGTNPRLDKSLILQYLNSLIRKNPKRLNHHMVLEHLDHIPFAAANNTAHNITPKKLKK